jgi:hypothetical protein
VSYPYVPRFVVKLIELVTAATLSVVLIHTPTALAGSDIFDCDLLYSAHPYAADAETGDLDWDPLIAVAAQETRFSVEKNANEKARILIDPLLDESNRPLFRGRAFLVDLTGTPNRSLALSAFLVEQIPGQKENPRTKRIPESRILETVARVRGNLDSNYIYASAGQKSDHFHYWYQFHCYKK